MMSEKSTDETQQAGDETTHFGFRTVRKEEKESMVRGVFDSVAGNYDLMNDVMSMGVHRLWKNEFIDWMAPRGAKHLLDVAGGTGDIAARFMDKCGGSEAGARVTLCDINHEMLKVGKDRMVDEGRLSGFDWVCGNAEMIPAPSNTFDYVTIAFGIRNVTNIDKALGEMYRVLKPGGRFMCLEFSQVVVPGFDKLYDFYSFKILPRMGELVAKDAASYQYLAESIRRFPNQEKFADMIRGAGFGNVKFRNLSGGIAAIHSGYKI